MRLLNNMLLTPIGLCCATHGVDSIAQTPVVNKNPNIILIVADDLGYSDLRSYGGEIETPAIDRMAAEGVRFRQFYNQGKSEPTRAALMTGMYHGRAGIELENPAATLGEVMRTGGYRTYLVGKWHLPRIPVRKEQTPVERGFDAFYGIYAGASNYFASGLGKNVISLDSDKPGDFITTYDLSRFQPHDQWGKGEDSLRFLFQTSFPEGYYTTDAFGDHAMEFINDAVVNHSDRPFFLFLSFTAPHTPLQAPVPLIEKYRSRYEKGWDVIREEKWHRLRYLGIVDPHWSLPPWRDDVPRWDELSEEQRSKEAHRRAVYAAMVDNMDQNIAKVLNQLDELGIADNTLVLFISDNGAQPYDNATPAMRKVDPSHPDSRWCMGAVWASLSNMPFRYNKQSQHHGGNCTPLVARWPLVVAPGTITDEPGHVIDLMATFVDISDADYNSLDVPPMDGSSLLPVFKGGDRPPPSWGFEFGQTEFAVIKDDWKLVNFRSGPWRIFNIKDDRTETNNLAWKYPEKVKELADFHREWALDVYGTTSSTFDELLTIDEMGSQHMRYTEVLTSDRLGFYSNPPVNITLSGIGDVSDPHVSEIHEIRTVESSGTGMTGATEDEFTFVYKPFTGDGEVIARFESANGTGSSDNIQFGVMMRESEDTASPFVMTGINQVSGFAIQVDRKSSGGKSAVASSHDGISGQIFLRLKRRGNVFTSSYSTDQYVWVDFATTTVSMPDQLITGLAVASGGSDVAEVVFREWDNIE